MVLQRCDGSTQTVDWSLSNTTCTLQKLMTIRCSRAQLDSACAPGTAYIAWCCTISGSIPACLLLGDYIIYLSTASRICCPAILLETAVSFCFLGRSSSCETLCTHMFGIELAPSCDTPCTHDACLHICNKRC